MHLQSSDAGTKSSWRHLGQEIEKVESDMHTSSMLSVMQWLQQESKARSKLWGFGILLKKLYRQDWI